VSYEPVRQRLAQIEARHPGSRASDAARFGIGELYLAEGIPEMAERVWKDMIAARSQPSTQSLEILDAAEDALLALLYNRGREEAESGELGRAIADLDYVVMQQRWEGDRSQLFAELGDMCQVGSQWDDAIGYYQAALDHDPTPAMAEMVRFKVAICHFNAKRYQQAESAFEDLLKREPRAHVAEESRRFLELCRSPEKRPSEAEQR
jgi:tetratricopeptide (TPR) repeat protein